MKSRIVYPQLWLDDKFSKCSLPTKVLFSYLITCNTLGLTPFHHITDRQILFDTGLDPIQLEIGKKELTSLKWCFFYENWIYHNHECAYVNYEGRDRVQLAKQKELENVPTAVKDYFNPLITRYKPILNQKPEIINQEPETGTGYKKFQEARELLVRKTAIKS